MQAQWAYRGVRAFCYPGTDIFILCFSLVDPESYCNLAGKWYREIRHYCPHTPILLVGTKMDIRHGISVEGRHMGDFAALSREDGQRLCEEINGLKYFECSAHTGVGLEELFGEAARTVISLRYSNNVSP